MNYDDESFLFVGMTLSIVLLGPEIYEEEAIIRKRGKQFALDLFLRPNAPQWYTFIVYLLIFLSNFMFLN